MGSLHNSLSLCSHHVVELQSLDERALSYGVSWTGGEVKAELQDCLLKIAGFQIFSSVTCNLTFLSEGTSFSISECAVLTFCNWYISYHLSLHEPSYKMATFSDISLHNTDLP
jgi:hypothetical protein